MSKGALLAEDASTLYTIGAYLPLIIERRPGADSVSRQEKVTCLIRSYRAGLGLYYDYVAAR